MKPEDRDAVAFTAGMLFVSLMLAVFLTGFLAGRASAPAAVEAIEQEGGR